MRIALFIGIESFTWQPADFQHVIDFAKAHAIDTLLVKVFDGMQGEWYDGQFSTIYQLITSQGLACVPYGFHYGNNKGSSLAGEANLAVRYGQTYGVYCADMESSWDGQGDWAGELASLIATGQQQQPFSFWVSTWANIGDEAGGHAWLTNITHLAPVTQYFLPQAYNDTLYTLTWQDWAKSVASSAQIQPTFEISATEFGANNVVAHVADFIQQHSASLLSLWEWTWAKASPATVDAIVAATHVSSIGGSMSLVLSPSGCVCDVTQSNQLDGGSQDKCGPWAVSALKYAGLPGKGAAGNASAIQSFAHAGYVKYIGPDVVSDQNGSSIDNMHQFLHDAGNLHWWDITAISAGSAQSSDLAHLRAALAAGYPVLVTVTEQSVISKRLGRCPYPWQPRLGNVNHIFPIVGVDANGDFICADQLNAFEPWPQTYLAANIDCSWATVIGLIGPDPLHPWHAPIPSGDPTSWPQGWNAQLFASNPPSSPPVAPPSAFDVQAAITWNSISTSVLALLQKAGIAVQATNLAPPQGTGIYNTWKQAWEKGHVLGPPLTYEYAFVRADGTHAVGQDFPGGHIEWVNNVAHIYTAQGELTL